MVPTTDACRLIVHIGYNEDYDSISVLNARASLKADRDNPIPQDIEVAWNTYIISWSRTGASYPMKTLHLLLEELTINFWKVYEIHSRYSVAAWLLLVRALE